ncbi:MAG: serine hydrolase [Cyclobacteriaceae bacterium]|nr:serine hydrolase [Cyclobacteriaceae bacterium]
MKGIYISLVIWLFFSCGEENPTPNNFLDYQNPYFEYLNSSKLDLLNEEIKKGSFGDIHSLVIIRNDKIVFENYYSNYQRSDLHPIGTSTQSIVSALVGVMLKENDSISLSAKIIDLLPEYSQYFENIPQKDQIEIGHLLTNTSGLWWDEWTHAFGSEDNDAYVMTLSDDWVSNVLSTPMIREPGYEFNFNSGNGILMAPIIQELTGTEMEQYAKEKLFSPLEITEWKWEKIPGDYVNAAWGLHLRPLDLGKIGYLYLKDGLWNGQMIFEENWRRRSTRHRKNVSNYYNYGYFWWRFSDYADAIRFLQQNDVFFSWGGGGQYLFIIPHLDMVVVTTAGNYSNNETMAIEMLRDYILASVTDLYP